MQILILYTEVQGGFVVVVLHRTSQKLKLTILPSGKVGENFL